MVSVTPDDSSSAVLMVGSQNGPTVWKCSTTPAGPKLGHTAWKSGHSSSLWSRSPSHGVVMVRTYQSAPKKPAKNMTSEKMNQLMPQRYERSMRLLFRPLSDSWMASPNQKYRTAIRPSTPTSTSHLPQLTSFTQAAAPRPMANRATAVRTGWPESAGT